MRSLILLLLTGCAGAWYEPSEIEARTDWTNIDHDMDVFDGASQTYGLSLKWPLGAQRRAYHEQYILGEKVDRVARAVEAGNVVEVPPVVVPPVEPKHDDEPISIGPLKLPRSMFDDTVVGGVPKFLWASGALVLIAAAFWIFKGGAGMTWIKAKVRRKPKE